MAKTKTLTSTGTTTTSTNPLNSTEATSTSAPRSAAEIAKALEEYNKNRRKQTFAAIQSKAQQFFNGLSNFGSSVANKAKSLSTLAEDTEEKDTGKYVSEDSFDSIPLVTKDTAQTMLSEEPSAAAKEDTTKTTSTKGRGTEFDELFAQNGNQDDLLYGNDGYI